MKNPFYNALTIAGFDGSGGAGLQADLKVFSALGCYGTTVLTALPVQNTMGVRSIYNISVECIEEQLKAILDDIPIHAVKIGMLHREEIIETVARLLRQYQVTPIVLDPVMVAKSGDKLLLPSAIAAMKTELFPLATVMTPNLPEASEILGRDIQTKADMEQAAKELVKMGPKGVIVKGGHLEGNCDDCLCMKNSKDIHWFSHPKIPTQNTHGTGCTFSAAIAAFLAQGLEVLPSVEKAKQYLTKSIEAGSKMKIGQGKGPVHHFHDVWINSPQRHREVVSRQNTVDSRQ